MDYDGNKAVLNLSTPMLRRFTFLNCKNFHLTEKNNKCVIVIQKTSSVIPRTMTQCSNSC